MDGNFIEKNPIWKSGVFTYTGNEIGGTADPTLRYNVLRPPEEIRKAIDKGYLNLLPIVDGHNFLGVTGKPTDCVGVKGVTGENAFY